MDTEDEEVEFETSEAAVASEVAVKDSDLVASEHEQVASEHEQVPDPDTAEILESTFCFLKIVLGKKIDDFGIKVLLFVTKIYHSVGFQEKKANFFAERLRKSQL
jgi:hypothetical protein